MQPCPRLYFEVFSQMTQGATRFGRFRVRFQGVTSSLCFDFFHFRVALRSFKYP